MNGFWLNLLEAPHGTNGSQETRFPMATPPPTCIVPVAQWCPTLCNPMDCSPPGSSVHGISQTRILEGVVIPSSRGSSQPRDRTQVSHIVGGFFTDWATREAQKYWSGSPSLIQGFFPTQEWNRGHLHCRQILYQLSYQGSPLLDLGGILFLTLLIYTEIAGTVYFLCMFWVPNIQHTWCPSLPSFPIPAGQNIVPSCE